jgi:hypothetical protein
VGRYQGGAHAIGVDSCLTCEAGKQVNGQVNACEACPAGQVSTAGDPAGCQGCATGRYQASGDDPSTPDVVEASGDDPTTDVVETAHTYCTDCADGKVAPDPGTVECAWCPAGKYDDLASEVCALCGQLRPAASSAAWTSTRRTTARRARRAPST